MTHNFDFYRTVVSRLGLEEKARFAVRNSSGLVLLYKGEYTKNVFTSWRKRVKKDPVVFLASIPFVRNLIEYKEGDKNPDYLKLTSLLHLKPLKNNIGEVTKSLTIQDVSSIFNNFWISEFSFEDDGNFKVWDMIMDKANKIIQASEPDLIHIENKIVLSVAIRLLAEEYMCKYLSPDFEVQTITSNQTRELFAHVEWNRIEDKQVKEILERVLIITSENIHINSFMYEPIIDMSVEELIKLYTGVLKLK
jgi:hypothetical protein